MTRRSLFVLVLVFTFFAPNLAFAEGVLAGGVLGYYRYPALAGDVA
ncbi:MAG: hypothetical protein IH936_05900 [Acidobacteria bacterium]|nr:hypothetical protein [Acidobacteriota bacterium]